MKVLVCGGRDYMDGAALWAELDGLHRLYGITDVIHGAAKGADMMAHEWAYRNQVRMWPCPAKWEEHGKAAGPIRNQQMLEEHKPDLVLAAPGGRGTADMIERAKKAGVQVMRLERY